MVRMIEGLQELAFKSRLISNAEYITVESEDVREDFIRIYPQSSKKIRLLHYGIEKLELIKKYKNKRKENCEAFGLDEKKVVVIVGHNARKEHQHREIINAIDKLKPSTKEKIGLLFEKAKNFDELKVILEKVIEGCHELKKSYVCNEEKVYHYFSWDYVAENWIKIWGYKA